MRRVSVWIGVLLLAAGCLTGLSAQAGGIRVACIGNSITYGYGLSDPLSESYPAVLQDLLGDQYTVGNFGHSGATLIRKGQQPYDKTAAFTAALRFQPDIAVIELGVNDTDPRTWPHYKDEFKKDYVWLIDTLRKANPALKVLIMRPLPVFEDHPRFLSSTHRWFRQLQEQISSVAAATGATLIDAYEPFVHRPDLITDPWTLHPGAAGYRFLAGIVYRQISGDYGGLQLPAVFTDHMVLQRDQPIRIWGSADAGATVSVRFNGRSASAEAAADGRWRLSLPAAAASNKGQTMEITDGRRTILLKDLLIGDLWLCAGQSNMYFPLKSAKGGREVIAAAPADTAEDNSIRLLKFTPLAQTDNVSWDQEVLEKINRLDYFSGRWTRADANSIAGFSAVGYFFGSELYREEKVPVGLIELAVGGSPLLAWIGREALRSDPLLVNALKSNWRQSDFLMGWCRQRIDKNLAETEFTHQRHPYQPAYIDDAGVELIKPLVIRGVLWYQGESDAENPELYERAFPLLVSSWRAYWGQRLPFYYVQLSGLSRPGWPAFRDMQRRLLEKIPGAAMAVTSDVGDSLDVHYTDKRPVGQRLARLALHDSYKREDIVPHGPLIRSAAIAGHRIVLSFASATGLKTADGQAVRGFKVQDQYGSFHPVAAVIKEDKVYIGLPRQMRAVRVVYAWEGFADANLVNQQGLPASTFSMDLN